MSSLSAACSLPMDMVCVETFQVPPLQTFQVPPDQLCCAHVVRRVHTGTYGVLTLFGILPPAMAWRLRYGAQHTTQDFETGREMEVIPGGQVMLLAVAGAASAVVVYEVFGLLKHA